MLKHMTCVTTLCLAIAGCATHPPGFHTWSYQYASQQHSGNVHVVETTNLPNEQCGPRWRDEKTFQPSGVRQTVGFRLEVEVHDDSPQSYGDVIKVELPSNHGRDVVVRDLQTSKTLMLGVDQSGLVKQGTEFYYPQGYFIRAAEAAFDDQDVTFCLGVDRTYLPDSELNSADPLIRMDRLNVRFAAKPGTEQTFTFGSIEPASVTVRVVPL